MSPSGRTGARILLVSDDPTVGDACARALRLEGHEVWAALSPADGVRLAQSHTPGAIIVDLRSPLRSAAAIVRSLRELPALAAVPIAVVSGDRYPAPHTVESLVSLGVALHGKPLWLAELVELARTLVRTAAPVTASAGS